ncbi:MAG: hypothetical protein HY817_02885 [Candidatus Abawacabacteria bacterium]|nr:hypothetical protein [Candidatus Abawacabacteria bacterium]
MLKTITQTWHISRSLYSPQDIRNQIGNFLSTHIALSKWVHRLQLVAAELIANSCEHRFDNDYVVLTIRMTNYLGKVRVQIILDDKSNVLIMQRYNNLRHAFKKRKLPIENKSVHGRGLAIILLWTDQMQFSKKRAGGLTVKVVKTIYLA